MWVHWSLMHPVGARGLMTDDDEWITLKIIPCGIWLFTKKLKNIIESNSWHIGGLSFQWHERMSSQPMPMFI